MPRLRLRRGDPVGSLLTALGGLLLCAAGGLVALLAATAAHGWRLDGQVDSFREHLRVSQALLTRPSGSPTDDEVLAAVTTLQDDTSRMRTTTTSLPWRWSSQLPGLAGPLTTVSDLAAAGDVVARDVLPPVTAAVTDLRNGTRRGPLDLRGVTDREDALRGAHRSLVATQQQLAGADVSNQVVGRAHTEVSGRLRQLESALAPLVTLAQVGGGMTGETDRRRYLIVLQSPAESRATGGLVGGFIQVDIRNGAISVVRTGTNRDLASQPRPASVPGGWSDLWGPYGAGRAWFASNLSLDFPSATVVWRDLYRRQYGVELDGFVGVTPAALGHLLSAVGPQALPDGTRIDSTNAAGLLEIDLYRRYPRFDDEPARNAFQLVVLSSLIEVVLRTTPTSPAYVEALRAAVGDGSIRLASGRPAEQVVLSDTALGGALPRDGRAFVAWSSQNVAGTKLDVYLRRSFRYTRTPLAGGRERVVATATLRNEAPTRGLPAYVTHRADLSPAQRRATRPGVNKLLVATYLTPGATVRSVLLDRRAVPVRLGSEHGHPVVLTEVVLDPGGGTASLVVTADQPLRVEAVTSLRQPVTKPDSIRIDP